MGGTLADRQHAADKLVELAVALPGASDLNAARALLGLDAQIATA